MVSHDSDGAQLKPDRLLDTLEQLLAIDASELTPALTQAAKIVAEVLRADKVDVFLYEPRSETLVARGTSDTALGQKQLEIGMDRLPLAGRGRAVEVFRTGRSYHSGRADQDSEELVGIIHGLGVRSEIVVPLEVGGTRRGLVSAVSHERNFFSEDDMAFMLAVSRWTSLVVHRSELMEALLGQAEERGRRETLERMLHQLTPRQLEVAILIAYGYSNQQIAEQLVLTSGTVANHVAQMLDRLGLDSRTQVAALVAEVGLLRSGLDGQARANGSKS
jgi:two-component system, OmpR family, sensor kinase